MVHGEGHIDTPGRLVVRERDGVRGIDAAAVILASGSRARSLPGLDIDGRAVITSDETLARTARERHVKSLRLGELDYRNSRWFQNPL